MRTAHRNMCSIHLIRLLLLCSAIQLTTQEQQQHIPSGIQTGPDMSGSSFASSVTYDARTNTILIAGSTFGRYFTTTSTTTTTDTSPRLTSNCFVATIVIPDGELEFSGSSSSNKKLEWSTKQVLGATEEDKVQEACTMALFHPQNKEKLVVLGFSEVGGKFDPLHDASSLDQVTHYGILLDVDVTSSSSTTPYRIVGGRALQAYSISYPIMVSIQNDNVYVVSQETNTMTRPDGNTNNQFVDDTANATYDINNEVDPMRYFKYGDKYGMSIYQYHGFPLNHDSTPSVPTDDFTSRKFQEGWDDNYDALSTTLSGTSGKNSTTTESAHASGLTIINDDILVTVGSTTGDGAAFGRGSSSNALYDDTTLHGFVTKFFVANGTIVPDLVDDKGTVQVKGTRRLQSTVDGGRVWVAGMCHHMTKEPNALYVVGAVEGLIKAEDSSKFSSGSSSEADNGVDAYIMKLDATTLEEIWIRQISGIDADSMVRGISCAVATKEDVVWVGGVVQDEGVISHASTISSFGGDDIFVVKLDSNKGEHLFTQQIGSTEDDGLAMRGGIALDRNDNCIVVGNTYGSMYRVRTDDEVDGGDSDDRIWISDVFVTTIRGNDGAISYPISHPDFVPQPGSGSAGESVDVVLPPSIEKSTNGSKKSTIVIVMFVFLLCGFVTVALYLRNRSKWSRDANTDRSKVIQFLNEFDVDDIDLKHSATGGWHCSYSNDLAHGHNRRALDQQRSPSYGGLSPLPSDRSKRTTLGSDPLLTAPLTSSSLIKESLFMNDDYDDDELDGNDDNRSNYGGGNRFTESTSTKQRPGYGGLLDEYNAGWNDRQSDDRQSNDTWGKEIL